MSGVCAALSTDAWRNGSTAFGTSISSTAKTPITIRCRCACSHSSSARAPRYSCGANSCRPEARAVRQPASEDLMVAYAANAEFSCFLALAWPLPVNVLDLYVETIAAINGRTDVWPYKGRPGLTCRAGVARAAGNVRRRQRHHAAADPGPH